MTVKNISGIPYYTVDDIQHSQLREYLKDPAHSSIQSLTGAGYSMIEYVSSITADPETHSCLGDLSVIFSIIQQKALEIRILSAQLKHALNIEFEEEKE